MQVLICENTSHGKKSGKAYEVVFLAPDGDLMLRLEPVDLSGEPLRTTDQLDRLIICYDRRFKHNGTQWWVGNIMWNGYDIPAHYALGLINTLHQSRKWTVSEAWVEIARAWMKPDELTGDLFELPGVRPEWVNELQTELKLK